MVTVPVNVGDAKGAAPRLDNVGVGVKAPEAKAVPLLAVQVMPPAAVSVQSPLSGTGA